jgi:hypothetical protein
MLGGLRTSSAYDEEEDDSLHSVQQQQQSAEYVQPQLTYFELRQQYQQDKAMRIQHPQQQQDAGIFHRVKFTAGPSKESEETKQSLEMIREAIQMRSVYMDDWWWKGAQSQHVDSIDWSETLPQATRHMFKMVNGVMRVWIEADEKQEAQTRSSRRWRKKQASTEQLQKVVEQDIKMLKITRSSSMDRSKEVKSPSSFTEHVDKSLGIKRSPSMSSVKSSSPEKLSPSHRTRSEDGKESSRTLSPVPKLSFRQSATVINFHEDIPSVEQFFRDLDRLMYIVTHGPCKSLAFQRLQLLEDRFKMHCMLNMDLELRQQKLVPHRDFYNVRKIDNHVHHSACMNQKHLLRFIKKKLKTCGDVNAYLN